jgi:hypothetical protein
VNGYANFNERAAHPAMALGRALIIHEHPPRDMNSLSQFPFLRGRSLDPVLGQFRKINPPLIVVAPVKKRPRVSLALPQAHEVRLVEMFAVERAASRMVEAPVEPPHQAAILQ